QGGVRRGVACVGVRGAMWLCGARALRGRRADTGEYDGPPWTQRPATAAPPARDGHAMAFDVARGVTVLHGGVGLGDTWEWNGGTWTQHAGGPAVSPSVLAYDEARARMVLVGASSAVPADTWERAGTSWTLVQPAAPL